MNYETIEKQTWAQNQETFLHRQHNGYYFV